MVIICNKSHFPSLCGLLLSLKTLLSLGYIFVVGFTIIQGLSCTLYTLITGMRIQTLFCQVLSTGQYLIKQNYQKSCTLYLTIILLRKIMLCLHSFTTL